MQRHHVPSILAVGILLLTGLFFLSRPAPHVYEQTFLRLPSGMLIRADIAKTEEERARGLGGRAGLGPQEGMYFVFDEVKERSFWMKDMRFPIDIVWLRDGTVVGVEANVLPPEDKNAPLPSYSSKTPVDAVLELSQGVAEEAGVVLGAQIVEL